MAKVVAQTWENFLNELQDRDDQCLVFVDSLIESARKNGMDFVETEANKIRNKLWPGQ